jgi:hypothetical protein
VSQIEKVATIKRFIALLSVMVYLQALLIVILTVIW